MGSRHEEEVPTHLSASTTRSGRVRFYMMKIRSHLAEVRNKWSKPHNHLDGDMVAEPAVSRLQRTFG